MRIVFFMQDTGAVFGAERATLDLAHGLRVAGHCPVFFLIEELRLSDRTGGLREAVEEDGFLLHRFTIAGRFSRSLARQVRQKFEELGGEVLHVIGSKANLHAWLSGIHPVVATVHGWLFRNDLKERMFDLIDLWCLKRCDGVICLSSHYEELLLAKGVPRPRLHRIASGLRHVPQASQLVRKPSGEGSIMTFGMLGRFSEEKNHGMFIKAAAGIALRFPEVKFVIAGQGHLQNAIEQAIQDIGLSDRMTLRGYMEVGAFMRQVDVYVLCSTIENLPYSILEAMAWARPVIGTRVGGVPDLVTDGVTGLLVPSQDSGALASAMTRLAEDPGLASEMGRNGRIQIDASFSLTRCVADHLEVYIHLGDAEAAA
ncbi:MAG: glycosyltransferase [Verrucomicrobia bacterium]|nr:glycosyltransferase [Verrucomicrobiota bacterium]